MTKPNFGPDFYLFDLNLGPILAGYGPNLVLKNFLWDLTLPYVMDCCKLSLYAISRETNKPNLRKWQKKTSFRSAVSPFGPNLVPKILFLDFSSTRC